MKFTRHAFAMLGLACAVSSGATHASNAPQLRGTWCFYDQSAAGNTVPEQVTLTCNADGSYLWCEALWKQKGTWKIAGDRLDMTDVGRHKIVSLSAQKIELERGSVMRLRKGSCS